MKSPRSSKLSELGPAALAGGLIAICCGAPLLLGVIAATGFGALLLSQGAVLLALAVLAGAAAAALWLRANGRIRLTSGGADCCLPTETEKQEKS